MTTKTGMDKEVKERWVTALRSGEYSQTKGALMDVRSNTKGYCCLGVLCEITGKGEWTSMNSTIRNVLQQRENEVFTYQWTFDEPVLNEDYDPSWASGGPEYITTQELDGEFNSEQMDYFGISKNSHDTLIDMNDNEEKSFSEIADWIEENL